MLFNKSLDKNTVVFGITDHFNDNDGHHQYAYTFNTDTNEVKKVLFISGYTKYNKIIIDATDEQKEIAKDIYLRQNTDVYSLKDYIGSTVVLKRSRKAKNGIELKVIDAKEGGYNSRFNNYQPDLLLVECSLNGLVWVSVNCAAVVKADTLDWIDCGYTVVTEEYTEEYTEEDTEEETVKVEPVLATTKAKQDKELLLLKNKYDKLLEKQRDSELYKLRKDRYKLTDQEYNELYFAIYDKYEARMYRAWLDK